MNLLLVGDGPERPVLEATSSDRNLSVRFLGPCYDEETLAGLFMAADVTVAPGNVGLTAIHSLGYGTPVITHNDWEHQGPEWEAIEPGSTGAFFQYGDSKDLTRAIREWIALEIPRGQIRAQCHRVIDRFYNPAFQRSVIDRAVSGLPADDPFCGERADWRRIRCMP